MKLDREPDEVVPHIPDKCQGCPKACPVHNGFLPDKEGGIATHDFWKPYHKYKNVNHAMCGAHLERELVYAAETGKQAWANKLRKLLQLICHRRKELMADNQSEFPAAELQAYLDKYDRIVARGIKVNPIPERKPGQRGRLKKRAGATE